MKQEFDAGKVIPTPEGEWASKAYEALCQVTYNGSSYWNDEPTTESDMPGISAKWHLLAKRGNDFKYDDFTEEQKRQLKQPIVDAANEGKLQFETQLENQRKAFEQRLSDNGKSFSDSQDERKSSFDALLKKLREDFALSQQNRQESFGEAERGRQEAFNTNEQKRKKEYDDLKQGLASAYNTTVQNLADEYLAKVKSLAEDYSGTKEGLSKDYEERYAALASDYNGKKEQLDEDYQNALSGIEQRYETDKSAWGKSVSDFIEACQRTFDENEAARQKAAADQREAETEKIKELESQIGELKELFGMGVEGYVRVSGVSDPAFNYRSFKHDVGIESVFDCIKPCLVGNNFTGYVGEILHVLNPLNWYEDEQGNSRKLDGSEGEVLITNIKRIYAINGKVTVKSVEYDVFLRSYEPFEWMGHAAEVIEPHGVSPHYCVSHQDDDGVTRMHSVYNEEWDGSYSAQHTIVGKYVQEMQEDGTITETYDADGAIFGSAKGLHTTNLALYTGEQYAMNLNEDTTATFPYFNATAHSAEVMFGHMVAEGGTFDAHKPALMGSGWCCNDAATSAAHWEEGNGEARNGFRYQKTDGAWVMMSIGRRGNSGFNPNKSGDSQYNAFFVNEWRSPWRCMEQQRVLMYAIAHNVPELTWFVVDGNKYKWRHVDGFAGPSEGVMTAVVWKLFTSKFGDGMTDSSTGLDVSGLRTEMLICSAIYRGQITDVSPSWWTSGLIFTEDENGDYDAYMQRDQRRLVKSVPSSRSVDAEPYEFEKSYLHVGHYTNGSGYRKDYCNDAIMLPKDNSVKSGGSLHTYVGGYNYFTGTKASVGSVVPRGFRRGNNANNTNLSPLYVNANNTPSNANSNYAFGNLCAR